jgi:thioredoxin-related protein
MSRSSLFVAVASAFAAFPLLAQDPPPAPVPAVRIAAPADAVAVKKPEVAVYDEAADGRKQVAQALAKAKRDNQRVLIQWGANWCGWCKWLAGTMKTDRDVSHELLYEYQVVHIDVGKFDKHKDLAKELGAEFKAIPFLTVLDADGKPLVQQNTEPFEVNADGKHGHDPKKLLDFLKQNEAKHQVASDVLAAALATAKKENKRVFLHFGAPWCIWCHRLEDWMARPEIASLLGKDFVDVKIDNDRMDGGKDLYEAEQLVAKVKSNGIPWFVFLDTDGKVLANANNAKGTIGFPSEPEEVAHFVTMVDAVKQNLTAADVAMLKKSLDDIHEQSEAAKKKDAGEKK